MSAQSSLRSWERVRQRDLGRLGLLSHPWVWVTALTLLAFFLRRYRLGAESLWFDEADIVSRAGQPVEQLIKGFAEAGENGPLYTLLLHFWLTLLDTLPPFAGVASILFGSTVEAPVRGLSAIFGAATIPLVFAFARQLGGIRLAFTAGLLVTFNPFHIWYSQDAKMYTLLVFITLAATLLYLRAWRHNSIYNWLGYVVATWVMLTVHSMSSLVLLAHIVAAPFIAGVWRSGAKQRTTASVHDPPDGEAGLTSSSQNALSGRVVWVRWCLAMLLILTPLLPIVWLRLAALFAGTADVGGWYARADLTEILATIFVTFAINRAAPPWEAIASIVMATLAFLGLIALVARWGSGVGGRQKRGARDATAPVTRNPALGALLALWLVPVLAFWLVTLNLPLFQPRYLIMVLPSYLILAGAGILALARVHPLLMASTVGVLSVATGFALTGVNYSAEVQKEDWRGAMVYVQDRVRLRDVIVVSPGYLLTAVQNYYEPGGPGRVPPVEINTIPSLQTQGFGPRELEKALEDSVDCHERAWLILSPPRQAREDPEEKVLQWFQYNWHTFDKKVFNGVEVYGISFNEVLNCWYPPPDYPEVHTFQNGLQFSGYIYELRDQSELPVQPDASYVPLTLYWRAERKLEEDYLVRIRIADTSGKVVVDEALGTLNGYWPTSEWPAGVNIIDYRDPRLPGGLKPGDYMVTLQLYPKGKPDQPLKLNNGDTEIRFKTPLKVVPWTK